MHNDLMCVYKSSVCIQITKWLSLTWWWEHFIFTLLWEHFIFILLATFKYTVLLTIVTVTSPGLFYNLKFVPLTTFIHSPYFTSSPYPHPLSLTTTSLTCFLYLWVQVFCLFYSTYTCAYSVAQLRWRFCNPMDCSPPGSSVHWIFQARILVAMPFSKGSNWRRLNPGSATWQVDSLLSEPPGKPKNFGVGSLFLLQGTFPTQGSKPGVLCFLHWQVDSLPLNHLRSPHINEIIWYLSFSNLFHLA